MQELSHIFVNFFKKCYFLYNFYFLQKIIQIVKIFIKKSALYYRALIINICDL